MNFYRRPNNIFCYIIFDLITYLICVKNEQLLTSFFKFGILNIGIDVCSVNIWLEFFQWLFRKSKFIHTIWTILWYSCSGLKMKKRTKLPKKRLKSTLFAKKFFYPDQNYFVAIKFLLLMPQGQLIQRKSKLVNRTVLTLSNYP